MRLKSLMPRSLYGRFLLIIVVPVLIVQVVSIYVFYYSHLDGVSKYMARSVASEMAFVKAVADDANHTQVLEKFAGNVDLKFVLEKKSVRKESKIGDSDWRRHRLYSYINLFPLIDPYHRFKSELNGHRLTPYEIYKNPENDRLIMVQVTTEKGVISYDIPVKRITSSSSKIFTLWMFMTALITSIISIIFLKNQIKSIKSLRSAADKFGRGQDVPDFKPTGSREIRSVAISFIQMKERIVRQITQRTDMLSAVSHDLRTPLTRMKLQLAMMEKSQEIEELQCDIADMEKLVEEYLEFVRGDDKETGSLVPINQFLQNKVVDYYARMDKNMTYHVNITDDLEVLVKKTALKRAVMNLVDNAFHYGEAVLLSVSQSKNNLIIMIEDDGPGIPPSEYANVFKPFYRLDASRNLDQKNNSGGSGLGLAIVMDGVTSQGGRIRLSKSSLGGLRVSIYIPL